MIGSARSTSKGNAPMAATVEACKTETASHKDFDMNTSTSLVTSKAIASQGLSFQGNEFDVVDRCGQPWLKAADIARALGYAREDSVSRLYDRNAEEFTDSMSLTVKLTVKGFGNGNSEKEVRIFSLRGAHLLAMFARTAVAKAFRKWVLDILDAIAAPAAKTTPDTRTPLRDAVSMLVGKKHLMYPDAYAIVHQRFAVAHIDELTTEQIPQAVEYVHRLALDGEWLPAQKELDLQPQGYVVTPSEAQALSGVLSMVDMMRLTLKELDGPLRALGSKFSPRVYDSWHEIGLYMGSIQRLRHYSDNAHATMMKRYAAA